MKAKARTLTKQQLVRQIGRRTRLANRDVSAMIEALIMLLSDHLASGGRIEIANFLTLEIQTRSRLVRHSETSDNDPLLGTPTETFSVLKCRPGKRLRLRLRTLTRTKSRRS